MAIRLFERSENNNPDASYKIAFGKAATAALNMTFTNFFAYLRSKILATDALVGFVRKATQIEVDAGVNDDAFVTPLKLAGFGQATKQKIVDIGDWNMDATTTVFGILHGLDPTKIRGVNVLIRNDSATTSFNLLDQATNGAMIQVLATSITLTRQHLGFFDNFNFSVTPYNRGWIVITYVP